MSQGFAAPSGALGLKVKKARPQTKVPAKALTFEEIVRYGFPRKRDNNSEINAWKARNLPNLMRGVKTVAKARALRVPHFYGQLSLLVLRESGDVEDYGLVSCRVVTTAGVGFIVDAFQNLVELENLKFHGIGTGAAAEAVGDTALGTELTTQYNPDSTRATGTTTENAANVYRTVGTNTVDAAVSITEHGILSQAATGGGVLLDRSVFTAVALASGDSLQSTYDFTVTAGS